MTTITLNGHIELEFISAHCAFTMFSTCGTKFFLEIQGLRTCYNLRMQLLRDKSTQTKLRNKQLSFSKTPYSRLNLTAQQNQPHLLPMLQ